MLAAARHQLRVVLGNKRACGLAVVARQIKLREEILHQMHLVHRRIVLRGFEEAQHRMQKVAHFRRVERC